MQTQNQPRGRAGVSVREASDAGGQPRSERPERVITRRGAVVPGRFHEHRFLGYERSLVFPGMEWSLLWLARALWLVLAFTSAFVLDDALESWSSGARIAVAVIGWLLWGTALLALFAPRPWGFTVLRVAVTAAVLTPVVAAAATPAVLWLGALGAALCAVPVVTGATVAHASAQNVSYGYERRFPLRSPFALIVGGIPVAAALVILGATTGVVLLADERYLHGVIALVVGLPFAGLLARALHGLDTRWLIVVPAGFVIADSLTLSDPVLIPESALQEIGTAPTRAPVGSLDLRLGIAHGSVLVRTSTPAPVPRRTSRSEVSSVSTDCLLVAPLRAAWFETALAERPRVRD